SRDKTPYKTNIGIQFRHERGKDIHAPGFYLHIAPDDCFLGIGLWHPDTRTLGKIRESLEKQSDAWLAARDDQDFQLHFTLAGDSLVKPPRGFTKDHPLIEDLRRKDFIALGSLAPAQVTTAALLLLMVQRFHQAAPYMRFLCQSLDLPF
ncbi:MAG: TIGR02453 family protein, partial [Proteobacteria bacterium]|nr:TIGR02453 family protein [Pseudomonadota bacterium]